MTLSLSAAELEKLERAQRTLLSPLDYPTLDAWRHEVNTTLKELLGADLATFAMPVQNELPLYNPDIDLDHLLTYPSSVKTWDRKVGAYKRMAQLGVWTRRMTFGDRLPEYYRSAHYNEWIVPTRVHDALGATVALGSAKQYATLSFHHDHPTGRKFGRRGLEILSLLHPAFEAGVRTFMDFHRRRESLLRAVDTLHEGVLVYDRSGQLAHQNPVVGKMLGADPEQEHVWWQIQRLVRSLLDGILPRHCARTPFAAQPHQTFATRNARYRIQACYLGAALLGDCTPVMVTLSKERRDLPTEAELQARFRLTEREASVALLLAHRYANAEIATTLGISPHTAHHHTERVLGKLGVSSRNRVRKRLQRVMN